MTFLGQVQEIHKKWARYLSSLVWTGLRSTWGEFCHYIAYRISPICGRLEKKYKCEHSLMLTFKCLHNLATTNLKELLVPYMSSHSLRSSDQHLLTFLKTRLKAYGDGSFSKAAPAECPATLHPLVSLVGSFQNITKIISSFQFWELRISPPFPSVNCILLYIANCNDQ